MNIKEEIKKYMPFNEQEETDKEYFLKFMETFGNVLTRENTFGHFSASAFVINENKTKMLAVYHNINGGWIYPGGHADGESDLLSVAAREVEEETGVKPKVLDKNIFAIQSAPIKGHIKKGKYISAHIHFDVIYLLEANENEVLKFREEESKGVDWISFEEATGQGKYDIVDFMIPIHDKLIKKLKSL